MAQRAVMHCLSLDDWKVPARFAIPAGELMLSRIRNYVGSRSEVKRPYDNQAHPGGA